MFLINCPQALIQDQGHTSVDPDKLLSKLLYPRFKLMLTTNQKAVDDARQFATIQSRRVPSLERGILCLSLGFYSTVPKSNQSVSEKRKDTIKFSRVKKKIVSNFLTTGKSLHC